jgi:membrane-bound lytic murein transglycosylase D
MPWGPRFPANVQLKRRMMKHKTLWMMLAAGALMLGGCEETAIKQVHARPPAATPMPATVPAPSVATNAYLREPLPLLRAVAPAVSSLGPDRRPAIDILVAKVEASVNAGQKDFQAGNTARAQADFDHGVDLILASGFREDADLRLSKLFNEIGDAVQADDLNPDKTDMESDSETPAEPAPIDEIADLTLPAGDPRLALKAQNEMISVRHDLPLTVNDSVLQYLSFFTTTRGRAIVSRGLERAGRYNEMIRRVLKEEGVPQDLIYLAQAESAFQPQAVSRAGARGIWQFMPYRGEEYDLERTYWIDERSDPEKATRAAARHLRDLYAIFGDWYLVMAAYNSGPMNVQRAIERTGYADFWELQKRNALPKQTQNYVPIILALAFVAKDPALYGVQVAPEKPELAETISLNHTIDLHLVADAANADFDAIRMLNPELLRSVTPNVTSFQLKLPAGAAKNFEDNIGQVPEEKWTAWRLHAAEQGETLSDIARRYRVTVPAIEAANHLDAHASVPAGFLLNVPTAPPVTHMVRYRVQRGDTLAGIAGRFDVTVEELKRWNHISGGHLARGSRLRIYAGSEAAQSSSPGRSKSAENTSRGTDNVSDPAEHGAKPGEIGFGIAREPQTTFSALRQAGPFLADRPPRPADALAF